MLARPLSNIEELVRVLKLRRKFNDTLDDLARNDNLMHIMSLSTLNEFLHFNTNGDLSANGQTDFWVEVNDQMKLFDYHQIELKPFVNTKAISGKQADKPQNKNESANPLIFTPPAAVKKQEIHEDDEYSVPKDEEHCKKSEGTPPPKKKAATSTDQNDHTPRRYNEDQQKRFHNSRCRLPSPPPRRYRDHHSHHRSSSANHFYY